MLVTLQHLQRMPEDLVLLQDTEEVDKLQVTTTMEVQLEEVCQPQEHHQHMLHTAQHASEEDQQEELLLDTLAQLEA